MRHFKRSEIGSGRKKGGGIKENKLKQEEAGDADRKGLSADSTDQHI